MEIVLAGPSLLFAVILFGALLAASAATLLRKKGTGRQKALQIAIAAIVVGVVLFFVYRPKHVTVDSDAISSNAYGSISIPWNSVTKAFVVDSLDSSAYKPVRRVGGAAIGDYKAGWFTLTDGKKVWVVIETPGKTLIVEANGMLYLFSPKELDRFIQEVERHVSLSESADGGTK
jgi:hypothetical protein